MFICFILFQLFVSKGEINELFKHSSVHILWIIEKKACRKTPAMNYREAATK